MENFLFKDENKEKEIDPAKAMKAYLEAKNSFKKGFKDRDFSAP